MSKEDYIYKNFVFEDSAIDGEAICQSDSKKTSLLESRWEFVDETITARGNKLVVILKMRKKEIFFELEEIEDLTKPLIFRKTEFKGFKENCSYNCIKNLKQDIMKGYFCNSSEIKTEDLLTEELLYIISFLLNAMGKIRKKFKDI